MSCTDVHLGRDSWNHRPPCKIQHFLRCSELLFARINKAMAWSLQRCTVLGYTHIYTHILNSGSDLPVEEGATGPKIPGDEKMPENSCGVQNEDTIPSEPSAQTLNGACITRGKHVKPSLVTSVVQHQEGNMDLEARQEGWGALGAVLAIATGIPCHFGIAWAQCASALALDNCLDSS